MSGIYVSLFADYGLVPLSGVAEATMADNCKDKTTMCWDDPACPSSLLGITEDLASDKGLEAAAAIPACTSVFCLFCCLQWRNPRRITTDV